MTAPDFELFVSLRAERLVDHLTPDADAQTEGENVDLARDEARRGLPTQAQRGRRYDAVVIERRVLGQIGGSR
jgi:hypothetical protein